MPGQISAVASCRYEPVQAEELLLNPTWRIFSINQPQAAHPVLTADGFSCRLNFEHRIDR